MKVLSIAYAIEVEGATYHVFFIGGRYQIYRNNALLKVDITPDMFTITETLACSLLTVYLKPF